MHEQTLFYKLSSWSHLYSAYQAASKGKRSKPSVALFEMCLEDNLLALQNELRSKAWFTGEYETFYIHEPKRRLISAAPFADRVVHHALCNIIEPPFERSFVKESFANRVNKGNHKAVDSAQKYARQYRYVLQLDICKFFPSIDHMILRRLLSQKIKDIGVLWLIDLIISSGTVKEDENPPSIFPNDDLIDLMRPKGLPIGNLTSQFWGNVYMNPIDHFIKRELGCQGYVRYVDDFLLFSNSKKTLWCWKKRVIERLQKFRLNVHAGTHPFPVTEGVSFLGFRVFPNQRSIKRRKAIYYQRKLAKLLLEYEQGNIVLDNVLDSVLAWNNHARYGNTVGLRKSIFSVLPEYIAAEAYRRYETILKNRQKP